MPPKEKKGKKSKKSEEEDPEDSDLTAVDKQFYELTIADINKKLTRLRAHNVKIEERNEEMELRMKQIETNSQDVVSYLNRTLKEKVNMIQELEDKLTELSKVRHEENENFKKKMLEWENKYKMMHDNLTSEIKLLTGKLNSMEEFRLQRDDLIAKFDTQEFELKDQAKKHKEILYEMERKVILDKERMRKDVENKLLELSTEFTKTSDLRVAASTQRLLRENIALNNDMDRILNLQARLQKENEEMKKKHKEIVAQYEASVTEKKRLIKTCDQQMSLINKLSEEFENSRLEQLFVEIKRSHEVARRMTKDTRNEMLDHRDKINMLEQQINNIETERDNFKQESVFNKKEFERISEIIEMLRITVKLAIKGEKDFKHDPAFHEARRNNLLTDLLNILNNADIRHETRRTSSVQNFYGQGDLGFLPKLGYVTAPQEGTSKISIVSSRFLSPRVSEGGVAEQKSSDLLSVNIIDPLSGSLSFVSDSNESFVPSEDGDKPIVVKEEKEKDDEKVVEEEQEVRVKRQETSKTLSIDLRQSMEAQTIEEVEDDKEKDEIEQKVDDFETDVVATDDNEAATDENDQ
ncbi:LOW QUALITY PROTEIN: cilia- and flagella-associated protein 157-like [Chironomus tepperi]|uniref:LOW QUALITY PROTEIN: cilia- and flagella-associated protein 157-like n=1 Tax=Chironomus tepperi TaxID=113505 RepID=UPI00391EF9F4